jgi:uncharacterized protein
MPMIRETVITTISPEGRIHIAPIGLIAQEQDWIIAPFHPSTTLDNLRTVPEAVASHVTDVRIIAGCLTGRRDWPTIPSRHVRPPRLQAALTHDEMRVVTVQEDARRPRFRCRIIHRENHAAFEGFNRAQAAVVEAAILVSRLFMLPRDKVEHEFAYLEIAVSKTAGPEEQQAWDWLTQAVAEHYR